ncbi:TPA: DUF1642 domain-containing protein [Streptococcus suis 2651]|uniref:DUF1642 domain-containing protein n=1 Tax=Streptococcus suis TaxID=1307 RepID=UPI000462A53E|nr:DUF1642 domain-containing protein [Streptococcus suis]HEL1668968.1 DUF1642 domain-containing protein [Streptococcus suis]HEL1754232.1 DUF1642 domain-containing protein [Streptococcus suis]HEM3220525.1 DUF1642 domain-containing protein [Streptococcus suis 2651]
MPAFIDSYIRYAKAKNMSLFIAMDNSPKKESEWIIDNEETFVRAWYDGYEVEQEQLYTVEIPNPNTKYSRIVLQRLRENALQLKEYTVDDWKTYKMNQLTEAEIKQDFEWAWQWAKPVEVE